jgi:N-acetylmuramoyl-L-alanine amidase
MLVQVLSMLALALSAVASAAATLERVEVLARDLPVVRLRLDAAVAARSQELPPRDGQPARIVIDLPGTRLGAGARGVPGTGRLRRVRLGQLDATTARVVLDLDAPSGFTVAGDGAEIEIQLADERAAPPVAPAVTPSRDETPASAPAAPVRGKPGAAPYLDYDDRDMQPLPTLPRDWKH